MAGLHSGARRLHARPRIVLPALRIHVASRLRFSWHSISRVALPGAQIAIANSTPEGAGTRPVLRSAVLAVARHSNHRLAKLPFSNGFNTLCFHDETGNASNLVWEYSLRAGTVGRRCLHVKMSQE